MSSAARATTPAPALHPLRVLPVPRSLPTALLETTEGWEDERTHFVQGTLAVDFDDEPASATARRATGHAALPDARQTAGSMAQALVEIMAGTRPAPQALRWTSTEVYTALARRATVAARRGRGGRARTHRIAVRRVLVGEPADGVVEATVVVVDGTRIRAMALRLEGRDGRWRVTALQVG